MTTAIQIPDLSGLDDERRSVEHLLADEHIETPADLPRVVEVVQAIKARAEELDGQRKSIGADLRSALAKVDGLFAPVLKTLKGAEAQLKEEIKVAIMGFDASRTQALNLAAKAGAAKDAAEVGKQLAIADNALVEKVPGLSLRRKTKAVVVDKAAAVRALLELGRLDALEVDAALAGYVQGIELREEITVAIGKAVEP